MFETERLILRAYKESDLDELIESLSDYRVQVVDSIGFVAPRTPNFRERFQGAIDKAFFHVILETKSTHEYVGFILLMAPDHFPKNRDAEMGISLSTKHWDKGYGSEALPLVVDYAFRGLGVHRVSLGVFGGNERAVKVYERVGFVKEATLRKCNWVEGEWRDITQMGILEEEWRARKEQEKEKQASSREL